VFRGDYRVLRGDYGCLEVIMEFRGDYGCLEMIVSRCLDVINILQPLFNCV